MTDNEQRVEGAIDNLLFDERRTVQRTDVETLVTAYRGAKASSDSVPELLARIAAISAEGNALVDELGEVKAKLDAVPVDEIRKIINEGVDECWLDYSDSFLAYKSVEEWLTVQL